MSWWDEEASRLLRSVRASELDKEIDYGEEEVLRSVVHTRDDIVLLFSQVSSLNRQIWQTKLLLLVIIGLMAFSVF
jgi:hypothetical protein